MFKGRLRYVELSIIERYEIALTARDMKRTPVIQGANFVRKNFQGTTFLIAEEVFKKIKSELEKKNEK